jgi:transcriptional regulator of met regulon
MGIHAAGDGEEGCSVLISLKSVLEGIARMNKQRTTLPIASPGNLQLESMLMPTIKSSVNYLDMSNLYYLGREQRDIVLPSKSRVTPTKCSKEVAEIFFNHFGYIDGNNFGKPMMRPHRINGEYVSPYNIGLAKVAKKKKSLNPLIMSKVVKRLTKHLIDELTRRGVKKLSPLTMEAAINGVQEDAFLRRMNAATSAGWNLKGGKAKHMPIVSDETDPEIVREVTGEARERVRQILEEYKSGKASGFRMTVNLKDEARPAEKCQSGKTRFFYNLALPELIVARMFLAPFYTLMQEHSDVFKCAIGINIYRDANKVAKTLKDFSELQMEGDYKEFDTSMPFDIGAGANQVIYNVLKHFGYNDEALKIVMALLSDSLFPIIDFLCDVFMVSGLQGSGKYGTAEDNSLRNLIMLMYFWYSVIKDERLDFFDYVCPCTLGDDILASVKQAVSNIFNNNTYQKFCEEEYGIEYTSASKSSTMGDFLKIEECTFLKRTFNYSEKYGRWIAPIDLSSIYKSLVTFIPSKFITVAERMQSALCSAAYELFFHLNEDEHKKVCDELAKTFSDSYLEEGDRFELPSHAEIEERVFG